MVKLKTPQIFDAKEPDAKEPDAKEPDARESYVRGHIAGFGLAMNLVEVFGSQGYPLAKNLEKCQTIQQQIHDDLLGAGEIDPSKFTPPE